MAMDNPQKPLFLKTLLILLFSNRRGPVVFHSDNILLIDDSPEKSVCNYTRNVIFLSPWNRDDRNDNFLCQDLFSWLRNLHF
jgi:hypothetical protein